MNKKKKILTVVTLVILMLGASVFTVSAADNHSVDENTTYVTNFAELEKAQTRQPHPISLLFSKTT